MALSRGSSFALTRSIIRYASSPAAGGKNGVVNLTNGGDGMNGKTVANFDGGSAPLIKTTMEKLYDYKVYGNHAPKPTMRVENSEELQFEVPAPGLDKAEIKMRVDSDNRFVLTGENPAEKRLYKMFLQLPKDANFEKATFKARLDRGLVCVTVTDFQKKSVDVHFTTEE